MPANSITAKESVGHWVRQLSEFFQGVEETARSTGWSASRFSSAIAEDPFNLGAALTYEAPVMELRRRRAGAEETVTFEPRHRFANGAPGQIDVYSYPRLREAMLLRAPNTAGAEDLTWEQAEERAAEAPWRAFSQERLPLRADFTDKASVIQFLEDLVA